MKPIDAIAVWRNFRRHGLTIPFLSKIASIEYDIPFDRNAINVVFRDIVEDYKYYYSITKCPDVGAITICRYGIIGTMLSDSISSSPGQYYCRNIGPTIGFSPFRDSKELPIRDLKIDDVVNKLIEMYGPDIDKGIDSIPNKNYVNSSAIERLLKAMLIKGISIEDATKMANGDIFSPIALNAILPNTTAVS